MLGKFEGISRMEQARLRCLYGISDSMDMSLSKLWEWVMDRESCVLQSMGSQRYNKRRKVERRLVLMWTLGKLTSYS